MKTKKICNKCSNRIKKIIKSFVFSCCAFFSFATTAFAADVNHYFNSNEMAKAMGKFFNFLLVVAIPLSVIGLATCAFLFFTSDEKTMDKAKKRIKNILISTAAIYLIPLFIVFGYNLVKDFKWNSDNSNTYEIVHPATKATINNPFNSGDDGGE